MLLEPNPVRCARSDRSLGKRPVGRCRRSVPSVGAWHRSSVAWHR